MSGADVTSRVCIVKNISANMVDYYIVEDKQIPVATGNVNVLDIFGHEQDTLAKFNVKIENNYAYNTSLQKWEAPSPAPGPVNPGI